MENITLMIDEIHAIRQEHSQKTKNMSFDEYQKLLDMEIAPALLALDRAKNSLRIFNFLMLKFLNPCRNKSRIL